MTKYIITYECAHWCGGESHVVVDAPNPDHAVLLAEDYMDSEMRELFSDEYEEDPYDDECAYAVNSVEILDRTSKYWKYYNDPSQSSFYPEI